MLDHTAGNAGNNIYIYHWIASFRPCPDRQWPRPIPIRDSGAAVQRLSRGNSTVRASAGWSTSWNQHQISETRMLVWNPEFGIWSLTCDAKRPRWSSTEVSPHRGSSLKCVDTSVPVYVGFPTPPGCPLEPKFKRLEHALERCSVGPSEAGFLSETGRWMTKSSQHPEMYVFERVSATRGGMWFSRTGGGQRPRASAERDGDL